MDLAHTYYEPAGNGPHPTIIALHGWGASAFDLFGLAPLLAGGTCQVLCPQGPLPVPLGGTQTGFGWFPLAGSGPPVSAAAVREAADRVHGFLARAIERYPIDPTRLVLLGFSQGGVLAYLLALSEPDRFAGLAALSSWLPPAMLDTIPKNGRATDLPTLVQHGASDEIIAVARAEQSVASLKARGVPVTYREYPMGHEISAASLTDLSGWLAPLVGR